MKPKVLAIIPAYNEEECLENTVEELRTVLPNIDFIVINDGSTDDTKSICERCGYPHIDMPVNSGLTVGFQTGMKYAYRSGYDYAVQYDADGQHTPESIPRMLDKIQSEDLDIVIGSRYVTEKKDYSARMIGSRLITLLVRLTTGKQIEDPTSGLRMYNRSMIEKFSIDNMLNPEPESLAYLVRRGAKIGEVQVSMRERFAGDSYLNLTKSISYMVRAITSILFVQWFRR